MFVVEISFTKSGQQSEIIYVRRPHFIIGSLQNAHVVVDEMASFGYSLHFVKGVRQRGLIMQKVCEEIAAKNEGHAPGMTAVLGLPPEKVKEIASCAIQYQIMILMKIII